MAITRSSTAANRCSSTCTTENGLSRNPLSARKGKWQSKVRKLHTANLDTAPGSPHRLRTCENERAGGEEVLKQKIFVMRLFDWDDDVVMSGLGAFAVPLYASNDIRAIAAIGQARQQSRCFRARLFGARRETSAAYQAQQRQQKYRYAGRLPSPAPYEDEDQPVSSHRPAEDMDKQMFPDGQPLWWQPFEAAQPLSPPRTLSRSPSPMLVRQPLAPLRVVRAPTALNISWDPVQLEAASGRSPEGADMMMMIDGEAEERQTRQEVVIIGEHGRFMGCDGLPADGGQGSGGQGGAALGNSMTRRLAPGVLNAALDEIIAEGQEARTSASHDSDNAAAPDQVCSGGRLGSTVQHLSFIRTSILEKFKKDTEAG